jgi:RHS repeat-associated protein
MKYYPFGETRYINGALGTDRRFTGQREETGLGSLYDYGARFYSPYLNRWLSPDTIVPDLANPQSLNRYSYVRNNPLKYIDPSGHREIECDPGEPGCGANGRWLKISPSAFIGTAGQPSIQSHKDIGYSCSPTALYDLLYDLGVERRPLQTFLDEEFIKGIPVAEGGLDPEYNNAKSTLRCRANPVCTSLKAVERVADDYATEYDLKLTAGQNWTKERILESIVDGIRIS